MKMPRLRDYADSGAFMRALDQHQVASNMAYYYLRGMYDATAAVTELPAWIKEAKTVRHIELTRSSPPFDEHLEVCLHTLSSNIMEDGMHVVRVCHGIFESPDGPMWSCWAQAEPPIVPGAVAAA